MANFQFSVLAMLDHFDLNLLNEYQKIGVKQIHYDIIDNDFYKGNGYHGEWIKQMHQNGFKINVHIMARNLPVELERLPLTSLNALCFQIEPFTSEQVIDYLDHLKSKVKMIGIAVEFNTMVDQIDPSILTKIDYITLMSVKPGKGGQKFSELALENLKKIKTMNQNSTKPIRVHLDGGVDRLVVNNTKFLVDNYVSGSYFFKLDLDAKKEFLQLINLS